MIIRCGFGVSVDVATEPAVESLVGYAAMTLLLLELLDHYVDLRQGVDGQTVKAPQGI